MPLNSDKIIKPLTTTEKRKLEARAKKRHIPPKPPEAEPEDDHLPEYDPIDNPFIPDKKPPERKSQKTPVFIRFEKIIKPLTRSQKRKIKQSTKTPVPSKPTEPTDSPAPEYDPIDHPFVSDKPPKPTLAESKPINPTALVRDTSKYDPIDNPYQTAFFRTAPDTAPSKITRRHPLFYGVVLITILIPLIALVLVVMGPVGEIFREFQEFRNSLQNDPGATGQKLLDTIRGFIESRTNQPSP
jgi:hypothetical protein